MKQKLLLMVLALGMCSININAQTKTYHVEDDGFEWYSFSESYKTGAQDKYGNIIIPLQDADFFYSNGFFKMSKYPKYGVIDKQGQLIVPMEYDNVCPLDEPFYPFIIVKKDGNTGAYDKFGNCIIPTSRGYKYVEQQFDKN